MTDAENGVGAALQAHFEDFDQLAAWPYDSTTTKVLNVKENEVTAYTVDVETLTCECTHGEMNENEGQVCKHIAKSLLIMPHFEDYTELQVRDLQVLVDRAAQVVRQLEESRDLARTVASSETAAAAAESESETATGVVEAADKLQAAFDDVIDAMQVTASDNYVFFQTGRETPDEWPYPGGENTFDVVTGHDVVEYVHDGTPDWADAPHPAFEEKPGEWYKNAIAPSDVDTFIEEVLS